MGGLNAALSVATGALSAQEATIETTNNNIANANTPGYTREIVNFSSAGSTQTDNVAIGSGVSLTSITSVRDQLLGLRIQQQTSEQSSASAQSGLLVSIQPYFSPSSANIGSELSSFFTSLSALSTAPSNMAARQTVISNAQDVVNAFQTTSAGLTSSQSRLNTQVASDVSIINTLSAQIASLNTQINQQSGQGQNGGTATDQRNELEQKLAGLTGISIVTTAEGDTITTGNGTALVVASRNFALSTNTASNGLAQIQDSAGTAITGTLTGGDLGGLLQARDTTIPKFVSQLDTLANGFAKAFNAAQASGFDLAGVAGAALFTVPSTVAGSAAEIALRTTNGNAVDGSAIAISSDGSPGSNGNLAALTLVQSTALSSGTPPVIGLNPTDSYAALVNSVGNAVSKANTQSIAIQSSLLQLTNQQSSVSGVSIDEESSNLIRYQQAYQAAAEVVTTIRSLLTTTLNMVSGA